MFWDKIVKYINKVGGIKDPFMSETGTWVVCGWIEQNLLIQKFEEFLQGDDQLNSISSAIGNLSDINISSIHHSRRAKMTHKNRKK